MHRVFATQPLSRESEEKLKAFGTYIRWQGTGPMPESFWLESAAEADAILTRGIRIDESLLMHAKRLRVVSTPSVGYDHFDLNAMKRHHVIGTHTPGVLDDTVADLAMALVLATARRIVELDGWVRQGRWAQQDATTMFGIDVHHRTIGIIGMGRIGEAVAKRAHYGFGMNVLYYSRTRHADVEPSIQATYVPFDALLERSDFVVLLTPLTPETTGLMNQAAFARMKPSAIFINISRGKTVDEEALYRALSKGQIRAAGLDVFATEPALLDNPLLSLPNVVATPHIGSATKATRDEMEHLAVENVLAILEERFADARIVPELQDLAKAL